MHNLVWLSNMLAFFPFFSRLISFYFFHFAYFRYMQNCFAN